MDRAHEQCHRSRSCGGLRGRRRQVDFVISSVGLYHWPLIYTVYLEIVEAARDVALTTALKRCDEPDCLRDRGNGQRACGRPLRLSGQAVGGSSHSIARQAWSACSAARALLLRNESPIFSLTQLDHSVR